MLHYTKGNNIMAIFPGKNFGTKTDEITIVAAHWDTVLDSPGFNDNGSGVSALLEIARALGQSKCSFKNSIILAALGLGHMINVKESFLVRILSLNT